MKRKGKKSTPKNQGGTGIMPSQFSGKKPMVKGGDGKKSKDMGRMMGKSGKSREKRLEGKAL